MKLYSQTILITGAAGFVGSNLLRHLVRKYPKTKIAIFLKKQTNTWRIIDLIKKTRVLQVDLRSKTQVSQAVAKIRPNIIFHLASYGTYPEQADLEKMIEVNIIGLKNLFHGLNNINYNLLVNTGSSSEYGFKKSFMKETNLLEPNSYYATSKASSTLLTNTYGLLNNRPIVTLRLFSVFGPYEQPGRLVPTIILNSLQNKNIKMVKNVSKRDFVYIDDVVEAYLNCANINNFDQRIFNICSGRQTSVEELVKMILKLTKSKSKILPGKYPNRAWDSNFWVGKNELAKKTLDWQPKFSLKQGLIKSIEWFKKNRNLYE